MIEITVPVRSFSLTEQSYKAIHMATHMNVIGRYSIP